MSRIQLLLVALVSFGATAASEPTQLLIAAGDNQNARVGERVPGVVCVVVKDEANRAVPGISVTWKLLSGGGSLTGETQLTDAHGIATLGGWTLGPTPGINTIQADSSGLTPVVFTATANGSTSVESVATKWNNALLITFQNLNTQVTVAARALGMVHTSMFDAWAAYDEKAMGTQLGETLRRPEEERTEANKTAAISYAAYHTLMDLFPTQRSQYDALMAALKLDPNNTSADISTPAGIGNAAAAANITFRHGDGSNQLGDLKAGAYSDYTGYVPTSPADQNHWQPLIMPNGTLQQFLTPQWGSVATFAIGASGSKERQKLIPKAPAQFPGKAYTKQAQELLDLSANLNDQTKSQAAYWIDKAGTVTPPGHWFKFAQFVSQRDGYNLDDDIKMYFALGNAMLDVSVAVWEIKRHYDSVRPVTAIRLLFNAKSVRAWGGPGLGTQMVNGETWQSYIDTPPFAEYVSGHSTFSAAGAQILTMVSGNAKFGMTVDIPPGYTSIELNVPASAMTFSWAKFMDAANDAGFSRRLGGIHFKDGDMEGRKLGAKVAKIVWKRAQGYVGGGKGR